MQMCSVASFCVDRMCSSYTVPSCNDVLLSASLAIAKFCSRYPPSRHRLCFKFAARASVRARAEGGDGDGECVTVVRRREVLSGVAASLASGFVVARNNAAALAAAAKAPEGLSLAMDNGNGHPFIPQAVWQELELPVKGLDVEFKDAIGIEPLETVSLNISKPNKNASQELPVGSPAEVAKTVIERVLSSPTQKPTLMDANERVINGKTFYQFEFTAEPGTFTRHAFGGCGSCLWEQNLYSYSWCKRGEVGDRQTESGRIFASL